MVSYKENLVLSQISYVNYRTDKERGLTIGALLDKKDSSLNKYLSEGGNSVWLKPLESMRDWKIINYHSYEPSGYIGVAFQSPTGEIVVASRGTEFPTFPDLRDDAKITAALSEKMIAQFGDARKFVCETMRVKSLDEIRPGSKLSFTGHSLGGGLAQYLTHLTRNKGTEATTFNAVGVAQCLPGVPKEYPQIKNYCDAWDVIGNFGIPLGERIYTANDQRLDGPVYMGSHSSMDYAYNPLLVLEDQFDYATYKFNKSIDHIKDDFRKMINTRLLGVPYSHNASGFLSKCGENGGFMEVYRVPESEVKFVQTISKGIWLEATGIKVVGSTVDETIETFKSKHQESHHNEVKQGETKHVQTKPKPDDGFVFPKWFNPQFKQAGLASSLGYRDYDQLLKHSENCGEKNGVKYYITETTNRKIVLWDSRDYISRMEFPNRKAWEGAPMAEHLRNPVQNHPTQANDHPKSMSLGKTGGMGMR